MISEIIKKIKENDRIFIGQPSDISVINKISERMIKLGIPKLTEELIEFYKEINGLLFNGIEIFSYSNEKVVEPHSLHTIKNIYEYNRSISFGKDWQFTHKFLFIGKSDEELYALNNVGCKFCIVAREDYAIYHMHSSFSDLLYRVLNERGGIKQSDFSQKKVILHDKLKKILLTEIINEINILQKLSLPIEEIQINENLSGFVSCKEDHPLSNAKLNVDIIDNIILWSYNDSEPYKLSLKKYFNEEEIKIINKTENNY